MTYTYNAALSRIDITTATGTVLAFIEAKYFEHYPYFDYLLGLEAF